MQETQDPHYLRAVTDLSDSRKIVASCDIYSKSGIKLVSSGIRITSNLYDRLVKHKLLPQLDMALAIENMLDSQLIRQDVQALLQTSEKLKEMVDSVDTDGQFSSMIGGIQLPTPLFFKLTVAREKFQRIYQHTLLLVIVGFYLAQRDRMKRQEVEWVAIAALCQDMGLLHIDPQLLEPSHVMNPDERRHLYAHPLTTFLILGEFPELARPIADAVLEHHERMDGSGYPRGLSGEKISRYGQILAFAELVATAFDGDHAGGQWKRLEMMLKLNSRRYGNGLIGYVDFRHDDPAGEKSAPGTDLEHLADQVRLIAWLFDTVNQHSGPSHRDKILDIVQIRLAALRLELLDAGFDPRDPEPLIQLFVDDPECVADYAPLINEAIWRFDSLVMEISRLVSEEEGKLGQRKEGPKREWFDVMKQSLLRATTQSEE
ncbi:MAG: HD domain-containing protein [Sulfuritalea sp.]|nr:HD domain-containing protein [Sulfuritalea sp.]